MIGGDLHAPPSFTSQIGRKDHPHVEETSPTTSALARGGAFAMAASPAFAVYNDQTRNFPARTCNQGLTYQRLTVNYNDPNISTGQRFGTLPANAYITSIDVHVTTAFNAATTNLLTIGTTSASSNELVADCGTATACVSNHTTTIATGVSHLTTAAGVGLAVSGGGTWTGLNMPLYVKYAQTGTAATAGSATFVIGYACNDDQ